jgi:hypothetical protein
MSSRTQVGGVPAAGAGIGGLPVRVVDNPEEDVGSDGEMDE